MSDRVQRIAAHRLRSVGYNLAALSSCAKEIADLLSSNDRMSQEDLTTSYLNFRSHMKDVIFANDVLLQIKKESKS